jgi:hypothetical protein
VVNEDTGQLHLSCGRSAKTRDFIVDSLCSWWAQPTPETRNGCPFLPIQVDNGPESSGQRTQFLKRRVEFADHIGQPIQLLYFPPYHSQYHPVERCWGILEPHWNGTQLIDAQTMLEWAKTMTWKGIHPVVEWSRNIYAKGVSLSKAARRDVEARLERNPSLPKWDILIRPACVV